MSRLQIITGFKFVLSAVLIINSSLSGQIDSLTKVTVTPGKEYEAGGIHRFFFGDHWRDLWTTPIEVPVLDLDKFSGGITPTERGGGQQTRTLRFKNKQGVEFKFRTINKDPSKALPEELRETLASDLVQDQTSSANPMAPLIVEPVLKALGILQAEPFLCILPDSKVLGEYRKEFANTLGIIEIHPDEGEDEQSTFGGAEKISGTEKLIERLREDNDEFVSATEYLKARLADIFLGDWDRHIDQWRWARYTVGGKKYWYPIPRDRDQAFATFDGVFPLISAMTVTQLEHFSDEYYDIEGITWSGRYTDRRFLHTLSKSEWDSVTAFVKNVLTDSIITMAVKRLPKEMFAKGGEKLISDLKSRRDKLYDISDDFYYQTIRYVNIHCSDKDELAEINRLNDDEVEVKIFDLDKNKQPKKEPYYYRVFSSGETKEIRIILNGGKDKAIVSGKVDESIEVYISGDKGKDTLIDNSEVRGFLLSFIPIPDAETKTIFTDEKDETEVVKGPGTAFKSAKYRNAEEVEYPRDWGHDWRFAPWFNINPDDGLFLGGGAILYEFGFRRRPYVYRMELTGGYAFHAKRFRLHYNVEYNPPVEDIRYLLDLKTSGLEVLNFYGFGNESSFNRDLKEGDFYKVKQQQIYIKPTAEYFINANSTFSFGTELKYADTDEGPRLFELDPYGSDNMLLFNLNAEYIFDSRDNKEFPVSGIALLGSAKYFPPLKKNQSAFYKIKTEGVIHYSTPELRLSTIALKLGAEKIFGRFPFFEASFLGGESSLRGYDRNRFAGDASVYGNLELRLFVAQTKILFPVYLGFMALGDAGKVFFNNENTGKIRSTYGGGVWLSFIKPEYVFTFYIARSPEETGFYFNLGFLY